MLSQIAVAVADMIAELPDVPPHAVACKHLHEWDAAKLATINVAVSPRGADVQNASRAAATLDYRVGIVIAKAAHSESDAREVFRIAEDVMEKVQGTLSVNLTNSEGVAAFQSATFDCGGDDMLNEQNIYRATIEATYKVIKGL
jgi:hypothetical protein